MVRLVLERRAGGSFICLFYCTLFSSCFFVNTILTEAKSLTIDVVNGISSNDAYVASLGAGETIAVKLKPPVAGVHEVSLFPNDLENGPYPIGEYHMCNRKQRVTWQKLFPQAATDFQFVQWNNATSSTLKITTPAMPDTSNNRTTVYCFDLKDGVSDKSILVVAVAGAHRVAGSGFFSPVVFSTTLAAMTLLVSVLINS